MLDIHEVDVVPTDEYQIAGIFSFGRGMFKRGPIKGADTSYKKLHHLRSSQLVVSRLKAFEGAVTVVTEEFDGWFLSPEFPTFRCVESRLSPEYLSHICRWPDFWSMLAESSTGIGARRERVGANQLLRLRLRVPASSEQRRVSMGMERIRNHVADLTRLSTQATKIATALATSTAAKPDLTEAAKTELGWREISLASVMKPATNPIKVEPSDSYPNLGIYSFGRGLFVKPNIDGDATSARTLNRVRSGQFIYSRLFAFEGAYGFVPPEFDGYFVSNEFPTFDTDPEQLEAQWLATYLHSPARWLELASSSKGLGVRRQRVPIKSVLSYKVWLPPIEQQRAMVDKGKLLDKVRAARTRSDQIAKSLVAAALNEAFAELT